MTADLCPSPYVTYLAAATEVSSSRITTKCMTISYTSIDNPFPLPEYAVNPSYTRDAAYQRRRHARLGDSWIKELTFPSKSYGKSILTPSSTSYLGMLTQIPTIMSQWISSWLVGRRKGGIITVSTSTSNRNMFLHFSSQCMSFSVSRL